MAKFQSRQSRILFPHSHVTETFWGSHIAGRSGRSWSVQTNTPIPESCTLCQGNVASGRGGRMSDTPKPSWDTCLSPPAKNKPQVTKKTCQNQHRDAGKLLEWLGLPALLSQPREERGWRFLNSQLLQQQDFCGEHLFENLAVTSFTNIGPGFPGKELY